MRGSDCRTQQASTVRGFILSGGPAVCGAKKCCVPFGWAGFSDLLMSQSVFGHLGAPSISYPLLKSNVLTNGGSTQVLQTKSQIVIHMDLGFCPNYECYFDIYSTFSSGFGLNLSVAAECCFMFTGCSLPVGQLVFGSLIRACLMETMLMTAMLMRAVRVKRRVKLRWRTKTS